MYAQHATAIQRYAQQSPECLEHVIQFVAFTIHTQFDVAAEQVRDMRNGEPDVRYANNVKATGYTINWIEDNRESVWMTLETLYNAAYPDEDTADLMLSYLATNIPGLGLVKAGFALQLTYGMSGCLDTHNLNRFDLKVWAGRSRNFKFLKTGKARYNRVRQYNQACDDCGGTAALWDTWCDYVAKRWPMRYANGFEVSALHCEALGIDA